jgi:hypothetical protein
LSRPHVDLNESQLKKVPRTATASTTEAQEALSAIPEEEYVESPQYLSELQPEPLVTDVDSDSDDYVLNELVNLLPGVLKTLKDSGHVSDYLAFNRLLIENRFPVNYIAFLLFLDVVRWMDLDKSTTSMSYSDDVKLFWSTGCRLFHGRFLRFMGGSKNKGQIIDSEAEQGTFKSEKSKVNFVVPDRRVLQNDQLILETKKPGIIHNSIDVIAESDSDQRATYTICVDGKKLTLHQNEKLTYGIMRIHQHMRRSNGV